MTDSNQSNGASNGTSTLAPDAKIIDLINQRNEPFSSIEFFPPRTEEGVKNLHARMARMLVNTKPLFTDITWGAGGSTADRTSEIAQYMHDHGHVANMHLTCTNMDESKLVNALKLAYDGGIRNIVALRGDPADDQVGWEANDGGFNCALDLVKYIRKEFGEEFGISVAGYPEGHPEAIVSVPEDEVSQMSEAEKKRCSVRDGVTYVCKDEQYAIEMKYLKEKIDAGGDFILTQMFFDWEVYDTFVKDCRAYGINCPVVPGLMCINQYPGFKKMAKFCKTRVPDWLDEKMESLKDDPKAVKELGTQYGIDTCKKLLEVGVPGLHFYTLNLEKVVYGITDGLGWTDTSALSDVTTIDADAKSMVAVGSAWARVGDTVKCAQGVGTVVEIRKEEGITVVTIPGEDKPIELKTGSYEKVL